MNTKNARDSISTAIEFANKSPEIFWSEWLGGQIALPYAACSNNQLYSAYLCWCLRTGERYPFKKEQFFPKLLRFAESQGKYAQVKVMKPETAGAQRTTRMFLVEMPPVEAADQWATEAIALFEESLKEFLEDEFTWIEDLAKKAIQGEWLAVGRWVENLDDDLPDPCRCDLGETDEGGDKLACDTAGFIAAAQPTSVMQLIATIRRQRGVIASYRGLFLPGGR